MVESRLVRPGTAEVIYKSQEDAQKAVDLYHNRQLDGQPMNCLLVTPRSNAAPSRYRNPKTIIIYVIYFLWYVLIHVLYSKGIESLKHSPLSPFFLIKLHYRTKLKLMWRSGGCNFSCYV